MKKTLEKLKLVDHLSFTLPVSRASFIKQLSAVLEPGDPSSGDLANPFGKKDWLGSVDSQGFRIRRIRRVFQKENKVIVSGTFTEVHGKLVVETDIDGFRFIYLIIWILGFLFLSFISLLLVASGASGALLVVLLFSIVFFAGPFFQIKRDVKNMKYDIEREFFYIASAAESTKADE